MLFPYNYVFNKLLEYDQVVLHIIDKFLGIILVGHQLKLNWSCCDPLVFCKNVADETGVEINVMSSSLKRIMTMLQQCK